MFATPFYIRYFSHNRLFRPYPHLTLVRILHHSPTTLIRQRFYIVNIWIDFYCRSIAARTRHNFWQFSSLFVPGGKVDIEGLELLVSLLTNNKTPKTRSYNCLYSNKTITYVFMLVGGFPLLTNGLIVNKANYSKLYSASYFCFGRPPSLFELKLFGFKPLN